MNAGRTLHILAIDDDPALHCLVDRALQRLGFQVTTTTDGASGLGALDAGVFDLLIVDYDMPDMSGIEVVRAAQENPAAPPIIMLTGRGNERVAVEAFNLGAADYLVKDVDLAFLDLLPTVIERVLTRRRLQAERDALFAEVRESEERYRQLVELIPDGVAVVVHGQISLINPAGCRILGFATSQELAGMDFNACFGGEAAAAVDLVCNRALHDIREPHWREFSCSRKNGEPIFIEMVAILISGQGSEAVEVIFRDVTEKKQYQEQLEHLATFDSLTDLANRALFFEKFQQVLALSLRYKHVGALLFIDLDSFKTVNDTYGHDVGDLVLQEVAARLRVCVRQVDVVARLGGDEFIVVLAKLTHPDDAAAVAEKILDEVCRRIERAGLQLELTCSIGISLFPQHGLETSSLLRAADLAMYAAKRAGGRRYGFAELAMAGEYA